MKIIFLFPGYGSQFVGMCKEIYDDSRLMQEYFEEASSCLDINFVKMCFASSDNDLARLAHANPALFLVSTSLCSLLQEAGIQPDSVAGYGTGEFAALFAARSLNIPDGLYLLSKLSTLYESFLEPNQFKAIRVQGLISKDLTKIIEERTDDAVFIAQYEKDNEHVVTGCAEIMQDIEKEIKAYKAKVKQVPLAGLYSPQAQSVLEAFKPYMIKVDVKDLKVPLISGLDGRSIIKGGSVGERIAKSIVSPIKWHLVVKKLSEYDLIIEVGPPSPYIDELRTQFPGSSVISVSKPEDIELVKVVFQQYIDESENDGSPSVA